MIRVSRLFLVFSIVMAASACSTGDAFLDFLGGGPLWTPAYPRLGEVGERQLSILVSLDREAAVAVLVLADGAPRPRSGDVFAGAALLVEVPAAHETVLTVSNLLPGSGYDLWLVARDREGTAQANPVRLDARTGGTKTALAWMEGYPAFLSIGTRGCQVKVKLDGPGRVYAVVAPQGSPVPESSAVRAGAAERTVPVQGGVESVLAITNLEPGAVHDLWLVAADTDGVLQPAPVRLVAAMDGVRIESAWFPNAASVPFGHTGVSPPLTIASVSGFRMQITEMPWGTWRDVVNWAMTHGYSFGDPTSQGNDVAAPAVSLSWLDAVLFCNALSEMNGYRPAYHNNAAFTEVCRTHTMAANLVNTFVDWTADGYRLPTEVEWEYAARRLADGSYQAGDRPSGYSGLVPFDDASAASVWGAYAWFGAAAVRHVGQLEPNGGGLRDMSGNAWEWCWDLYEADRSAWTGADPRGPDSGPGRVYRGGGYTQGTVDMMVSRRDYKGATDTYPYLGFRVLRR